MADTVLAKCSNLRYLITILIQQCYVKQAFQFAFIIVSYIAMRSVRFDEPVSLLPDTNGMRLDATQSFEVFDRIFAHGSIRLITM